MLDFIMGAVLPASVVFLGGYVTRYYTEKPPKVVEKVIYGFLDHKEG